MLFKKYILILVLYIYGIQFYLLGFKLSKFVIGSTDSSSLGLRTQLTS